MSFREYLPKKEILFNKKSLILVASFLLATFFVFWTYLSNPKIVPDTIKVANDKIVDTVVGKNLAEAIDQKRDADGAVTIRELFNTNKEENLEKFCEKKSEQGKEKEKCFIEYVNEELGYSLSYPVGWEVYKSEGGDVSLAQEKDIEQLNNDEIKYRDTDVPFTFGKVIDLIVVENSSDLRQYASENILSLENEGAIQEYNVDNISGLYIIDKGPNRFGGGIGEYIIFKKDNKIYEFSFEHKPLSNEINQELSEIFKRLVSSFNF